MNRDQKATVVEEIAGQIQAADAIFAVDYRGIAVSDIAALRSRLRESGTKFRIVKNSLSERAAEKAGTGELTPMLEGPTAFAFVDGDAALAAKALSDMGRALNTLEFKGGLMNGSTLTADEIRFIARLPARQVLDSQLVGTIAAPLSGLVRTLNGMISGLALQLQAIADQGIVSGTDQAAADAAAPVEAAAPDGEPEAGAPAPEQASENEQEASSDEASSDE